MIITQKGNNAIWTKRNIADFGPLVNNNPEVDMRFRLSEFVFAKMEDETNMLFKFVTSPLPAITLPSGVPVARTISFIGFMLTPTTEINTRAKLVNALKTSGCKTKEDVRRFLVKQELIEA